MLVGAGNAPTPSQRYVMPWSLALRVALVCALATGCSPSDAKGRADTAGAAATSSGTPAALATAASDTGKRSPADSLLLLAADGGRITGDSAAKTWVIMVSDFQCPYCKQWHDSTYAEFRREYVDNGKVRTAFVNFPLQMHHNALPAAEAAMCASAQGKFWGMHDRIFETQKSWEGLPDARAFFDSLAVASGVEAPSFRQCVSEHKLLPLIRADYERATNSGVGATPTFIVVGEGMMSGAQPIGEMRKVIDRALAKAGKTAPKP